MLVYGDHREIADARSRFDGVHRTLEEVRLMPAGLERHAKLVGALIAAGQLLQGIADVGWPTAEVDRFLHHLAKSVVRSWDSGFAEFGDLPRRIPTELPQRVELRLPEGFAFYAVYPESYIEAARRLHLTGSVRVIGIRSIGTTLGAIVAAALDAPAGVTVRPFGDPFARKAELAEDLVDPSAHYVIVDEGPGISGSSFGAVADWLESRGVQPDRIAFLPSHGGEPGPQASNAHRRRWARAQRVPAQFAPSFLLERFGRVEEFSGGGPFQRRKYIGQLTGRRVLLKFAGLGTIGERKLAMARTLHAAGMTPEPLGLVHGFMIENWCEDAAALDDEKPVDDIGRYLGARARLFPAPAASGASICDLLKMCRRNISLAFGTGALSVIDRFRPELLSASVRRIRTDNKLDREEWLRLPGGRLLKTDAIDHHQAHDLIGCQDLAWDVAGAITEFDLNAVESARLIAATGRSISRDLLDFSLIAYSSFRLGQAELAAPGSPAGARYRSVLHHIVVQQRNCSATPHES